MPLGRGSVTRRAYLGTVGAAVLTGGCVGAAGGDELAMGVVPDVDPDAALEQHSGLATYLESELDVSVDLDTTADYAGLVQAMAARQVELAYFGGVSYVLAHHRAGARPVVVGRKDGSTDWHSAVVTRRETGLETMDAVAEAAGDLELVFGDPISTSGTVMPTYYLRTEFDCRPDRDFESVTHVGAHDATAGTIASGGGDVGALNARIYDALVADGDVGEDVVEIWRSPGFPDYPWAVAPSVDEDRREAVRDAFTGLGPADNEDVLDQQNVDGYVGVTHERFTELNSAVEMAGLLERAEDG